MDWMKILAVVAGITLPTAALILWLGLRPFRRSLEEAKQWTGEAADG